MRESNTRSMCRLMEYKNTEEKGKKKRKQLTVLQPLHCISLHHLGYARICLELFTFLALASLDERPAPCTDLGLTFDLDLGAWVDAQNDVLVDGSICVNW